jgi:periplasmic divalent cation tolerance protein
MNDYLVVLCTVPDQETGRTIAAKLLEKRLAACVNLSGSLESLYWWEGKIRKDPEHLLVIKTREALFDPLADSIRSLHPYDVPEIIALPIVRGSASYLDWITAETSGSGG